METKRIIVTGLAGIFYSRDPAGRRLEIQSRPSACIIVTVKGKIRFSGAHGCICASTDHPVFLPQGYSYVNTCEQDAESYVFNFFTADAGEPTELCPLSEPFANSCYQAIRSALATDDFFAVLRELYALLHLLFLKGPAEKSADMLVEQAMRYMRENFGDAELTVGKVAQECHVSEVYLRKLFREKAHCPPFRALTDMRMKKAYLLTKEKRPIKEIAQETGYSDVFSFSRAYKKYFGHTPSEA